MKRFTTVLLVLIMVAGCSGSDNVTALDEVTVEDLVGSWTASSVIFTNNAAAGEQFDLVANGGELRTTVLTGGGARTWFEFGTLSDEWDAQLTISGEMLISNPVESSRGQRNWSFSLNGTVLTLTDSNSEFDFSLSDATEVPATEVVTFVRQ